MELTHYGLVRFYPTEGPYIINDGTRIYVYPDLISAQRFIEELKYLNSINFYPSLEKIDGGIVKVFKLTKRQTVEAILSKGDILSTQYAMESDWEFDLLSNQQEEELYERLKKEVK